jgi:hypothetical protein
MTDKQVKAAPPSLRRRILWRIFMILLVGTIFSYITTSITSKSKSGSHPAGFLRGVMNGAMMPCALPNLLLGRDVPIYAEENTGRTYKLGYTTGVNGCGALFFGIFFWRINRWQKRMKGMAA